MTDKIDRDEFRPWIGRQITRNHVINTPPLIAMNAILNRSSWPVMGGALPIEAYWLYFLDVVPQASLSSDGHPKRGDFLPPVNFPRRMWAGVNVKVTAPICVGDAVKRTSEIRDIHIKVGKDGPLVFVRIRHRITAADSLRVTELQDIIFKGVGVSPKLDAPKEIPDALWSRTVTPDPILLFRYSALTFNSHRIHYDYPYATQDEGYRALVVQGPLIATLLLDLCYRFAPNKIIKSFTCRAEHPIYCDRPFKLTGRPTDDNTAAELVAWTPEGVAAFTAKVKFFD
jgi:3-methylfumaryl-CoA hydratase